MNINEFKDEYVDGSVLQLSDPGILPEKNYGIVSSYEEWVLFKTKQELKQNSFILNPMYVEYPEIVKYINKQPIAYSTDVIGIYKNKTYTIKTRYVSSIKEMNDYFDNLDSDYILYNIYFKGIIENKELKILIFIRYDLIEKE